jgi:hypothetical protein
MDRPDLSCSWTLEGENNKEKAANGRKKQAISQCALRYRSP